MDLTDFFVQNPEMLNAKLTNFVKHVIEVPDFYVFYEISLFHISSTALLIS